MRVLHVGSGGERLPDFWPAGCCETRLDISPRCHPDIVADMTAMGDIGTFDAVYTSHAVEHLQPHDVPVALGEFLRVLSPGGAAVIFVPDLEDVRPTDEVLFVSPAGPIAGLDLIYGHRPSLREFPYMAHHTGFIRETLGAALEAAGFIDVTVKRMAFWNLMATGKKA